MWDKRFGGSGHEQLTTVIALPDGEFLLGGWSSSEAGGDKTEASRGGTDYWVVKLQADGSKAWDKTIGGSGNDYLRAIVATADGGYLLGGYSASEAGGDKTEACKGNFDYWVVKLNHNGSKAWDRTYGGSKSDCLASLVTTPDGGYLLGGTSYSGAGSDKTEASSGESDLWVVKLNEDGSKAWDRRFGESRLDYFNTMIAMPDGNFLLGGITSASHYMYYYMVRLNANGTQTLDRILGGEGDDFLTSLGTTADGGFLMAGISNSGIGREKTVASNGGKDYWVVKLLPDGRKEWDKAYGGSGTDELTSLARTSDGGYLLGGRSWSGIGGDKTEASKGYADYWLVKITANGSKAWDKSYGGSGTDQLTSMVQGTDGSVLLAGYTNSEANGDITEASRGNNDYWVVKLRANVLGAPLAEEPNKALLVYPNPSQEYIQVHYSGFQKGAAPVDLMLYDVFGQQVLCQKVTHTSLKEGIKLQTNTYPRGTYFLRLQTQEKALTQKVILY